MNTCTISTSFSKLIKVNGKNFVIFLKRPDLIEIHGAGVHFNLNFKNTETTTEFDFTDDFIWNCVKEARKKAKKQTCSLSLYPILLG